jgi:hypothetical protein
MEALSQTKNISFSGPAAHILAGNVTKSLETVRILALLPRAVISEVQERVRHDGTNLDYDILG